MGVPVANLLPPTSPGVETTGWTQPRSPDSRPRLQDHYNHVTALEAQDCLYYYYAVLCPHPSGTS